jgi:hypothetical protein
VTEEKWYPKAYMDRLDRLHERPIGVSGEFIDLLRLLNGHELDEEKELSIAVRANYDFWQKHFEILKREFNALADLFWHIESTLPGWYHVSPNQAQWHSVGLAQNGYTFAGCIMKNHRRDAPKSKKSLWIGFTSYDQFRGIGDERMLGRKGEMDALLVGLKACEQAAPRLSLQDRYEGTRKMANALAEHRLVFRLNHHVAGQQTTTMSVDIFHQHSLVDLAEKLFWALNQDLLLDVTKELPESKVFLLD